MAQDYFLTDGLAGVDLDEVSTTAKHILGSVHRGNKGFFQYIRSNGANAAGNFVVIDAAYDATPMTTTVLSTSGRVGIGVAVATLADNEYGWAWVGEGDFEAFVVNAVAAGTALTSTATAGNAGTGGTAIPGLKTVDLGVTSTRVTVFASTIMTSN